MRRFRKRISWLLVIVMLISGNVSGLEGSLAQGVHSDHADHIITEAVVRLQDGMNELEVNELLGAFAPLSIKRIHDRLVVLDFGTNVELSTTIEALNEHPHIVYAELNHKITAQQTTSDPMVIDQWGLDAIEAELAWQRLSMVQAQTHTVSRAVYVAVLDTGVDVNHEDLAGRIIPGINVQSEDHPDDIADNNGHGTKVTGVINAIADNGIGIAGAVGNAPVFVLAVKALNDAKEARLADIYEAVRYAVDWRGPAGERVRVINMSFGERFTEVPQVLLDAVQYAHSAGVLMIAAAGNHGEDVSGYYPAAFPEVISVGATGSDNKLIAASNTSADVQAPGGSIVSIASGDRYSTSSGTSIASGFVTAAAALMLSMNPEMSVSEVRQSVLQGQPLRECPPDEADGSAACPVLSMEHVLAGAGIGPAIPSHDLHPFAGRGLTEEPSILDNPNLRTVRISVDEEGNELSNPLSTAGRISYNQFVVHMQQNRIVLHDLITGAHAYIDVTNEGEISNGGTSLDPSISSDGNRIVYTSSATNLGLTAGGRTQIYIRDRAAGTTKQISLSTDREQGGNANSRNPSISADGKFVVFETEATNLMDTNNGATTNLFVYDVEAGEIIEMIAIGAPTGLIVTEQLRPSLSGDGSRIVFMTSLDNLIPGRASGVRDIYLYDRDAVSDKLSLITTQWDDNEVDADKNSNTGAKISANGEVIVFGSTATNLVDLPASEHAQVYAHYLSTGTTELVSVSTNGSAAGNNVSSSITISDDGRYAAFQSSAYNLSTPVHTVQYAFPYIRDLVKKKTIRVGSNNRGEYYNEPIAVPSISGDGRSIVFQSTRANSTPNFVPNDTNVRADLYVAYIGSDPLDVPVWNDRLLDELEVGPTMVKLGWMPASAREGIKYYELIQDGAFIGSVAGDRTSGIFRGLEKEREYTFHVEAVDRYGNRIGSEPITLTTAEKMAPVMQPRVVESFPYALRLEWDRPANADPDADLIYELYRDGSTEKVHSGFIGNRITDEQFLDANATASNTFSYLEAETTYHYRIIASDNYGHVSEPVELYATTSEAGLGITTDRVNHPNGDPFMTQVNNSTMSADGRYIVFTSHGGLDNVTRNPSSQVYRLDRFSDDNKLTLISHVFGNPNEGGNYMSSSPSGASRSISADGKRVVFYSNATNLLEDGVYDNFSLYLYDERGGSPKISRVNLKLDGTGTNHESAMDASISADGQTIVFVTRAPLIPSHEAGKTAIYAYDVDAQTDKLRIISQGHDPIASEQGSPIPQGIPDSPVISGDGQTVAYMIEHPNKRTLVYVQDLVTNETVRIKQDGDRSEYKYDQPSISENGRYVSYVHHFPYNTGGQENYRAYVYDRVEKTNELISWNYHGNYGVASQFYAQPTLSADGRYVAYVSNDKSVVPQYTAGKHQVYLYDRMAEKTYLISQSTAGVADISGSTVPNIAMVNGTIQVSYESNSMVIGDPASFDTNIFVTTFAPSVMPQEPPVWTLGSKLEASQVGATSLRLSWSGVSSPTSAVTSYYIYQNDNPVPIRTVAGTEQLVTITGLTSNTMYDFKVEAENAGGRTTTGPTIAGVRTAELSIESVTWHIDNYSKFRNVAPQGGNLEITLKSQPSLAEATARIQFERNDESDVIIRDIDLEEASDQPGVYVGIFPIEYGMTRIRSVQGLITDAFGNEGIPVDAERFLPMDVSAQIAVSLEFDLPSGAALPPLELAVQLWSAKHQTGDYVQSQGNAAVDFMHVVPSDDYVLEVYENGVLLARESDVTVDAGGLANVTIPVLLLRSFSVLVVDELGAPRAGERVTITAAHNGQIVGTAITDQLGMAWPFGKARLQQGTNVQIRVVGTRLLYEGMTDMEAEVPALMGETVTVIRKFATEFAETGTVRGTVVDQGGQPIAGVRVAILHSELFQNFAHSDPFYGETNESGVFTVDVPRGRATIQLLNDDYVFTRTSPVTSLINIVQDETTEVAYTGELLQDYTLNLDIMIQHSDPEEVPLNIAELIRSGHLRVEVSNLDAASNGGQSSVVITNTYHSFKAKHGDRIEISFNGSQAGLSNGLQVIVVGAERDYVVPMELTRYGIPIHGVVEFDGAFLLLEANLYKLDSSGKRGPSVSKQVFRNKLDLSVRAPAAGTYLLQVAKQEHPQAVGEMIIDVHDVASVNIGAISLSEGRFFAGRVGNGIQMVGAESTVGMDVNLRVAYRNGTDDSSGTHETAKDVAMVLDLPLGITIVPNSIVVNGVPYSGSSETVNIGDLDPGEEGVVVLKVRVPADQPDGDERGWAVTARMQHNEGIETIGTVHLDAKPVTIAVPERIIDLTVHATGYAPAGSMVDIYGDGVWVGRAQASSSGYWFTEVALGYEQDIHWYEIRAVATLGERTWRSSETWVLYNVDQPHVTKLTLSMGRDFYNRSNEHEVDITAGVHPFPYFLLTANHIYVELQFNDVTKVHNVRIRMEGHPSQKAILYNGKYYAEIKREDWLRITPGYIYVDYDTEGDPPVWLAGSTASLLNDEEEDFFDEHLLGADIIRLSDDVGIHTDRVSAIDRFHVEVPRLHDLEGTWRFHTQTEVEEELFGDTYEVRGVPMSASASVSVNRDTIRASGTIGIDPADLATLDKSAPTWSADPKIIISAIGTDSVTLEWTPAIDDLWLVHYQIYKNDQWVATVAGNVTAYTAEALTPGQPYKFSVKATDIAGRSTSTMLQLDMIAGQPIGVLDTEQRRAFAAIQERVLTENPGIVRGALWNKFKVAVDFAGRVKAVHDIGSGSHPEDPDIQRLKMKLEQLNACSIPEEYKEHMEDMVNIAEESAAAGQIINGSLSTIGLIGSFSGVGFIPAMGLEVVSFGIGKSLAKDKKKIVDLVEESLDSWLEMPEADCEDEDPDIPPPGTTPPVDDPLRDDDKPDDKPIAKPVFVYDPSGYVFEAVEDNRLEDVLATIMYREDSADPWVFWDAEWFGQLNPHYTNVEGRYGWDVPSGLWQVIYEKDGYETAYSEELRVLPEHFDVNIGLRSLSGPGVIRVDAVSGSTYIDITFDKYVKADSITSESIAITKSGEAEAMSLVVEALDVVEAGKGNKDAGHAVMDNAMLTLTARVYLDEPLAADDKYRLQVQAPLMSYADQFASTPYDRVITVSEVDSTAPVVTITGNRQVNIGSGETYLELGATAFDRDGDGDMTNQLVIGGDEVNTWMPGVYQISYQAIDRAGNEGVDSRVVTVQPQPVKVASNDITEHKLLVYAGVYGGTLNVYNKEGVRVDSTVLMSGKNSHLFTLAVAEGYYATQTVNGVESARSISVDIVAVTTGPTDPTPTDPGVPTIPVTPVTPVIERHGHVLGDQDVTMTWPSGATLTVRGGQGMEQFGELYLVADPVAMTEDPGQGLTDLGWSGMFQLIQYNEAGVGSDIGQWPQPLVFEMAFPASLHTSDPAKVGIYTFHEATGEWRYVPSLYNEHERMIRVQLEASGTWALMMSDVSFEDISSHWAKADIEVLAGRQVISGRNPRVFDPDGQITRAEYVALLLRMLNLTDGNTGSQDNFRPFTDVAETAWYAKDVRTAWSLGLVTGTSETAFTPAGRVTREQMSVMMYNAWQLLLDRQVDAEREQLLSKFQDRDKISSWAEEAIMFVVEQGIIHGRKVDELAPKGMATRAEAAVVLRGFSDIIWPLLLEDKE